MYKLLATDVDDTILAPDGSLPTANREALVELQRRGVVVVLSSGRPTVSLRQMAHRIGSPKDDEYLISFNGARVTSALSDTPVFERLLSPEAIRRIMVYARSEGLFVQGYGSEEFLVEYQDSRADAYARAAEMSYRIVADLTAALPQGSAKLLVIHQDELIPPHRERLDEMAEGEWVTTLSKRHYLEIVAPGVSKGEALRVLAEKLGIAIEETIAVGDSVNDREMLQAAGLGVSVANARPELKEVADVILDRSAADGSMEEVLHRFFG